MCSVGRGFLVVIPTPPERGTRVGRTGLATMTTSGDVRYLLGTGVGITVHSDVAEDYAESRWKAERLLRVFDDASDEPATPGHTPSMPTP